MTPYRAAAVEGLQYAAHLVAMFGWEPASPEMSHLNIHAHLHTAASKTAVARRVDIQDTAGLMGLLLDQHLEASYMAWEVEPDRTADDVRGALLASSDPMPLTPA